MAPMQTYTLLFRDFRGTVRALSYKAQTAARAVRLIRDLPIRDKCELWTDGQYVCSLSMLAARRGWCVVSAEGLEVDVEIPAEVMYRE